MISSLRIGRKLVTMLAAAILGCGLSVAALAPADAGVTVTSHFGWVPTSSSLTGDSTLINNGATNGEPADLLFITPNLTPGGISPCPCLVSPQSPYGVWYDAGSWAIFNENQSTMGTLWSFNVLVVPKASKSVFVHKATSSNTTGDRTVISSKGTNGNPRAFILVTQDWNPGGKAGDIYNAHQVGVRYYKSLKRWVIFNEDGAAMPKGAAFNVLVGAVASNGGRTAVLTVTKKNRKAEGALISNPQTNGNPNNVTFLTENFNPGGKGGTPDPHSVNVAYGASREGVLHFGALPPKLGTSYNLLIFSS